MAVFFVWIKMWASRRDRQVRRPFVEMPRPAGWSLLDRMDELMDAFNTYLMMTTVTGAVSWAVASLAGNSALVLTAGIAACSVFLFLSGKSLIRYSNCRLGLLGELAVGQILDRTSSDTIRVFHDLQVKEAGKKPWNIDHVVLTPAGVFAIETKARRKPRDIRIQLSSPPLDFSSYCEGIDRDLVITAMVGDFQRIIDYPALGYASPQPVPARVWVAFDLLVTAGYRAHLA